MHREGLSLLDVSFNKIYLAKVIKLILPIMFLFIYLFIYTSESLFWSVWGKLLNIAENIFFLLPSPNLMGVI